MNALKRFLFCLALVLSVSAVPVFASDYIITSREGADLSAYPAKPLIEEAGIYITDKKTADELYSRGIAVSVEENAKLEIPDDTVAYGEEAQNTVSAYADGYNDAYYAQEIYFDSLKIKEYTDTYKPDGKVRIAVIDSGVNRSHIDFASSDIEEGYNFVLGSTDTADNIGHGTKVTSLIAAGANDGVGVAGIAPHATIVPLVVITSVNGKTSGSTSDVILAIKAAADQYGCRIINVSVGSDEDGEALGEAVKYASDKGVIVIAAAGNDGRKTDGSENRLNYPASCPGAISVGATDNKNNRAEYSQKNNRIDIAAFGGSLTMPSNTGVNKYSSASGTSFSAPVITGMTALFVSNHPDITPEEYKRILKGAAVDIGVSGTGDFMGAGMPDCMAMERMYGDKNTAFISPAYENAGTRNIKICSDGSTEKAILAAVSVEDGTMTQFKLSDIAFDGEGLAYIEDTPSDKPVRYFVLDSMETLKSLSALYEY